MGKLKTRHSAKKRFRKTVSGKFIRRRAFKGHLLEKKSSKRKRSLSKHMVVFFGDSIALRSMLPYL
jgi:large subunit ribosomal protein L35